MSAGLDADRTFDVAVVGGGIVGVSVALRCARAGAKVAVIDAAFNGRASTAGAGIVSPVGLGGNEASYEWSNLVASAISHYQRILGQLGDAGITDIGFGRVGELVIATREADLPRLDELEARLSLFAHAGLPVGQFERRKGNELRRSWPELRDDLDGVYIENIGRMDGRRMCSALGELAGLKGAVFLTGRADVTVGENGRCALTLDGKPLAARTIVLATGAWSQPFLKQLGVGIEVFPARGQILHLGLIGAITETRPVINTFEGHYFLGFPSGRIVTGATHEPEAGFDCRITAGGVHEVLARALRIAPGLASAGLIETRVGLRPRSSDGYPLVGRPRGAENLVVATGLGAWGLTLGPLIGEIAAEQALGVSPSFSAEFLRPDREPITVSTALSPTTS